MVQPGDQFKIQPGEGNLQIQALIAAVVGPFRLAHSIKKTIALRANIPEKISGISPASRHCRYIAMYLKASNPGPVSIQVGKEPMLGTNSSVSVDLEPRIGPFAGISYSGVLLPGDEIFAQALADVAIVVAEVDF